MLMLYFVGVVVNVNSESERIIVSLNERALSEEQETVKLVWSPFYTLYYTTIGTVNAAVICI